MEYLKSIKSIIGFNNNGNERSIKAKRNIIYSFIIKGISIVVSLVLVPLTLGYVDSAEYGIWLTISSILGWFTFFDLGFTHGFRNKCAEALARNDINEARCYVSTTYVAFIVIFSLVYLIFFVVNKFIDWSFILNIPVELGKIVHETFDVVAFFFCLHIVLGVVNSLLLADQKPAFSSFLSSLGQLLILFVIWVLTKTTTGTLLGLASVMSIVPVFVLLISSVILFQSRYRDIKPSVHLYNKKYVRNIVGLGSKFFVIQISSIFVFQALNIIISHVLGPEQVTIYNISYKCFNTFNMVFVIFLTPFWSAFTDAYTKNDYAWMINVYKKLYKMSWLFVAIILLFIILSDYVYDLWLGDKIDMPVRISIGMGIYVCLTTLGCVPVTLLNGLGKVKLQMMVHLFYALITIPCLLYVLENYDLFFGLLFISLNPLTHFIISTIQIRKILNKKAISIWNE